MNITTKTVTRAFATTIAAIAFAGVVTAAPPATAATWIPEPETTTTPAATFDIGMWVAERKARMAQDWVDLAKYRNLATNANYQDRGEMVAKAKARATHG